HRPWCRPRSAETSQIPVCARLAAWLDCPPRSLPVQLVLVAQPAARHDPAILIGGDYMVQPGKRPTIASRHGMVAAAHPLAAAAPPPPAAGARVLSNAGNASDAAAATAATLNVVEPYMSGLAGQGMATCYIASEKRVRSLNFMSRIPRKFPLEKLSNREQI